MKVWQWSCLTGSQKRIFCKICARLRASPVIWLGGGGDSLNVFLISFLMIFEKPLIIHRTPLSLSEQKDFSQFQHCSQSLQILSNDDHKVQSHDRPLPRIVFLLTLAIVDWVYTSQRHTFPITTQPRVSLWANGSILDPALWSNTRCTSGRSLPISIWNKYICLYQIT